MNETMRYTILTLLSIAFWAGSMFIFLEKIPRSHSLIGKIVSCDQNMPRAHWEVIHQNDWYIIVSWETFMLPDYISTGVTIVRAIRECHIEWESKYDTMIAQYKSQEDYDFSEVCERLASKEWKME